MKNLLGTLTIVGVFAIWGLASYAATNPNPFNVPGKGPIVTQAPAPTPAEIAPVPSPAVTVLPSASNPQFDILMWIWTALGTIFTAIQAKAAFKPAAPSAPGGLVVPAGVTDLLGRIKDPATKQALDAHLLQIALGAVQSGAPATALQTGLSLIPGFGPAIAAGERQIDPFIRDLGIKALQDMIAKNEAKAA